MTLTNVPHVDEKIFKDYISQTGSLYESFRRVKESGDDGRPPSSRRGSKPDVSWSEGLPTGAQKLVNNGATLTRADSANSVSADHHYRRKSGAGLPRRAGPTVAPLTTIPNVYSEEDFRLENPRTFDIVSERAEIVRPPAGANGAAVPPGGTGKKALAANAILQEKLSWYMDTVEIHLISSISTASTSFFAALGSLRDLHAEAEESVGKIKALREDLGNLDEKMAVGGLKIVALKRKRENVRKLGEAVRQLEEIVRLMSECEVQVENGEIEEALRGLTSVERLMAGDADDVPVVAQSDSPLAYKGNMIDLRKLKALEGVSGDLAYLRKRIGKAYERKFIATLLEDLRKHVDSVPANSTFLRWDKASSRLRGQHVRTPSELPAYMNIDGGFRSTLHTQLKGLARSDSITTAAVSYKDTVLKEFKNLVRRHLPSSTDDDVESTTSIATTASTQLSRQQKSSILARNLRALEPEDAEIMFKKIYANVGEALRRLGTQVKVLLDITSSLGSPHTNPSLMSPLRSAQMLSPPVSAMRNGFLAPEPSPGPPPSLIRQDEIQQTLDLSDLLGHAVDIAQEQITKILWARTEQSPRIEMPFFLRYFTLNRLFADECEAVSGRSGSSLKSIVNDHIKAFVSLTAEAQRQDLVQNMDSDKWKAKDFTEEDSHRLDLIITASTKPIESWTKATWLWGDDESTTNQSSTNGIVHTNEAEAQASTQENGTTTAKGTTRAATLEEEEYVLPKSALVVLGGLEVFQQVIQGIPSMSVDITTSMLDYLKFFNSRSYQLILAAGATRSAGLKNITTRHLALSSQSLNFVITIIPYVREFARRYLPSSSNMMPEFDDVKRTLQQHRLDIDEKLVDIMSGRGAIHIKSLMAIDWDGALDDQVSPYMTTLVKETNTLYGVLVKHLSANNVQMIMTPLIDNYRDQWGKAFQKVDIKSSRGKER